MFVRILRLFVAALFATTGSAGADPPQDYRTQAMLIDLGLLGGGAGLFLAGEFLSEDVLSDVEAPATVMMIGGAFFGGALSHAFHDNRGAVKQSIRLRLVYTGLGALGGAAVGLVVGGAASGIGHLSDPSDSYNSLPLMIAPVLFGAVGGIVGLGYGMHRDYSSLAVQEAPKAHRQGLFLYPALALTPQGGLQWSLVGVF